MTSDEAGRDLQSSSNVTSVDTLLEKCHELIGELEAFRQYLAQQKKEHTVELRQFRNSVASELKSLERLSEADPTAERTIHTLRSSNLPFYNAVWTAAKSTRGLVLFNKRFYWDTPVARPADGSKPRKRSALVDIVAEDGEEWIKVSTITETRLLFEKAKAGWEAAGSDSDSEEEEGDDMTNGCRGRAHNAPSNNDSDSDIDDDRVELLKMAEDLQRAAKKVRIRYKHPRIRFVLPKIIEGHNPAIDAILADIRATGAAVQCASSHPPLSSYMNGTTHAPDYVPNGDPLTSIFSRLVIDPLIHLTSTLNIDCTILLALISDLSHSSLSPSPTFHRAIRRQIDLEASERLLPSSLYPAMNGRDLVCTSIAARRMREIVVQIGTPSEKIRAELLLGEGDAGNGKPGEGLRAGFKSASEYDVPDDWKLPIKVVDGAYDLDHLPAVARKVEAELTEINRSVFLYGWASGWTTVSSNRTVAKAIESIVEADGEEEDEGPRLWLCPTARSLVGKEKGRRD